MLDYEIETEKGMYRILNILTERINKIRDIEWLNLKYGEYNKLVLNNQENNNTENINQAINKISNILNSIKKIYSLSKIEKNLIKEIKKTKKETDSEILVQAKNKNQDSESVEIPDMPEIENVRIGPQLEKQLTELLRETEKIIKKKNINREIRSTQFFCGSVTH